MGFEKEIMQQYIIANDKAARAQRSSAKQPPIKHPVVLENILDRNKVAYKIELGVLEIPMNQIVGIAVADQRELLYASNFMPLSKANTELANTWRHLYQEFLSDDGLRKPIRCYEHLGKFYVQDGAKRVSVLKYHGAATVFSEVIRIMPTCTQERNVQNYYEFLQHFRLTRLNQISFSNPEHFAKLQSALGHEANYRWNDTDRFGFLFHWHTIENAFQNEYIRSHERWEMVDIYADEGITGTSVAKRDDFQRMLSDCRKGRIDKILVKSISRFARNTTECLESIRELKALGISIFFEEHNIDTKMVTSEMLTAVLASCAQAESESISRNMRWSIQKRMENGTFNTCRAATGFRLSGDGLQVHPEEASVVCGIFEDYLRGMNTREIATRLNQEQALGRTWSRCLVDYMLMNERYAGNALLQKKYRTETMPRIKKPNHGERPMYYVRNSAPAIVSQEMFEKASELRNSRQKGRIEASGRPLAKTV